MDITAGVCGGRGPGVRAWQLPTPRKYCICLPKLTCLPGSRCRLEPLAGMCCLPLPSGGFGIWLPLRNLSIGREPWRSREMQSVGAPS